MPATQIQRGVLTSNNAFFSTVYTPDRMMNLNRMLCVPGNLVRRRKAGAKPRRKRTLEKGDSAIDYCSDLEFDRGWDVGWREEARNPDEYGRGKKDDNNKKGPGFFESSPCSNP